MYINAKEIRLIMSIKPSKALANFGKFNHIGDDLNFHLSILSGLLVAFLIMGVDYIHTKEKIYLYAGIIFSIIMILVWMSYLKIRYSLDSIQRESKNGKK